MDSLIQEQLTVIWLLYAIIAFLVSSFSGIGWILFLINKKKNVESPPKAVTQKISREEKTMAIAPKMQSVDSDPNILDHNVFGFETWHDEPC